MSCRPIKTTINDLPDEILATIFQYHTALDLIKSLQRVCTRWHNIINHTECLWKGTFRTKGIHRNHSKYELSEILKIGTQLKYLEINYHYLCSKDCALKNEHFYVKGQEFLKNSFNTKSTFKKKLFANTANESVLFHFSNLMISKKNINLLRLISSNNKKIEHLKLYDPHPPFLPFKVLLISLPNLKRITVKIHRLTGRKETMSELKKILGEFPDINADFLNEVTFDWYKISNDQYALPPITSLSYFDN